MNQNVGDTVFGGEQRVILTAAKMALIKTPTSGVFDALCVCHPQNNMLFLSALNTLIRLNGNLFFSF